MDGLPKKRGLRSEMMSVLFELDQNEYPLFEIKINN